MSRNQDFAEFIAVYPKYRGQRIARLAYAFAMTRTSHADLMVAVRLFAAEVTDHRPYGAPWRYCPAPARWLQEERWLDQQEGNR